MNWQAIIAYAAVLIAVLLVLRWFVRAVRGRAKLPACPGCKNIEICDAAHKGEEKEC
jgi:hypothetical protein